MAVAIPNMRKPDCCKHCRFLEERRYEAFCWCFKYRFDPILLYDEKPFIYPLCELKEIEDHE